MNRFDLAVEHSYLEEGILNRVSRNLIPLGWPKGAIAQQLRTVLPFWDEDNIAAAADSISKGIELGCAPSERESAGYRRAVDAQMAKLDAVP